MILDLSKLGILEITGQILLVPPFFENFGKRLIKSPKLYLVDSGLACHLLGIDSERKLSESVFLGPLFEGFVAAEIVKHQINAGRSREVYYFRDQQGLEVDFLIPLGAARLCLVEAKASATPVPRMADSLVKLRASIQRYRTEGFVVHRPSKSSAGTSALLPGIKAGPVDDLVELLSQRRKR